MSPHQMPFDFPVGTQAPSDWTSYLVKQIAVGSFVLVSDPDELIREEFILRELQNQGYEFHLYQDPILIRYKYETNWCQSISKGNKIILSTAHSDLNRFPYDWLNQSNQIKLSLTEVLPFLSYPILRQMPKSYLPDLFHPGRKLNYPLSNRQTERFILKYALEFSPEEIVSSTGLIQQLILLYLKVDVLPDCLVQSITNQLSEFQFPREIFTGRNNFFVYLQKAWETNYSETGSTRLFSDLGLQVLLRGCAWQGLVRDLDVKYNAIDPGKTIDLRSVESQIPSQTAPANEWQKFAHIWARTAKDYINFPKSSGVEARFDRLKNQVDSYFWDWLQENYNPIFSMSHSPYPRTVDKVLSYLQHQNSLKKALIVLDGLSVLGWELIKSHWYDHKIDLVFDEETIFAIIPTITTISRQSIFAGKLPNTFAQYLQTTAQEKKHWETHWLPTSVGFAKDKLTGLSAVLSKMIKEQKQILGVVVTDVDQIADSEVQGLSGLMNSLDHWLKTSQLHQLIYQLLDADYLVVMTSDHGQTVSKGTGSPAEGLTVDKTGRRARLYKSPELRDEKYGRIWNSSSLPSDVFPLLSTGYSAFFPSGKAVIAHGGASIEEVIVPFIVFTQH